MNPQTVTATASDTWNLGDLTVNRIGFGAMRLPQHGEAFAADAVPRDRDQAIRVLRRAVELGVNHIDTAAFYFSPLRSANELINRALAPYEEGLVITTKVGPGRDPSGRWLPHATPEQLRGQVEENLRQLGRDHLDVVNLRIVGTDSIAERFGALAELCDAGLIRHLGLSNIRPHHLAEAQAIAPVVCVQNMYGIGASPEQKEFLNLCGEQRIAFVPFYSIAGTGRTAGATTDHSPEVHAIARAHGVSTAQIRLAWTLHQGSHVLAIPGTGDLDHLAQNVAVGSLRLSEDELTTLDTLHHEAA
ncbi:aldo/keto reductase [Streptomyces sp. KPB2]|uniref:aldo/keto reductase n=1 Tax=Streptomyces TaxID=1883 RepID=UPI000F6E02E5|nr:MULTISPECIES: aldo/keto reductase [Streptomyces]WSU01218.1 aldo/keto reductase [Streptomyces sp. NBC_01124]AZM75487.1 aldo/keto reductase [Streptomyces sp. KPB2]MBH5132207.1 aldo/keto reductase [Streptomyces sp. HB-N217]MDU0256331.1 aldo/keto reductase [Streptomyces sp. PU10]QKW61024.1 aldo/keto reductase [Streptomyces sp. NA03103]